MSIETVNSSDPVTPKRRRKDENLPCSPPIKDTTMYPWNWGEGAGMIQLSPGSSCSSPESRMNSKASKDAMRRGRPRLDAITSLILEGSTSPSTIKCNVCNRVFPREKSLQAHLRTHTGERPYECDYPDCNKAFAQSGQLKTHQRLHTGEKPFICSASGCTSRFTHANRHCPEHPRAVLQRDERPSFNGSASNNENKSEDVIRWLEKYYKERSERVTCLLTEDKLNKEVSAEEDFKKEETEEKASIDEHRDKLLGALALIQLSKSSMYSSSENYPLDLSHSTY